MQIHSLKLEIDGINNLVIWPKNYDSDLPTVMVDGHSDEVVFMEQLIQSNGLIRFIAL